VLPTTVTDTSTLAKAVTSVEAAALFEHDSSSYIFESDDIDGVAVIDLLVELKGVNLTGGWTLDSGNISNIA
jgi:hypothetical protein